MELMVGVRGAMGMAHREAMGMWIFRSGQWMGGSQKRRASAVYYIMPVAVDRSEAEDM